MNVFFVVRREVNVLTKIERRKKRQKQLPPIYRSNKRLHIQLNRQLLTQLSNTSKSISSNNITAAYLVSIST